LYPSPSPFPPPPPTPYPYPHPHPHPYPHPYQFNTSILFIHPHTYIHPYSSIEPARHHHHCQFKQPFRPVGGLNLEFRVSSFEFRVSRLEFSMPVYVYVSKSVPYRSRSG